MRTGVLSPWLGLASLPVLLLVAPLAAAAPAGTAPHPGIRPYPGAKELERSTRAFDDYWMPLGRLIGEAQAERVESLSGRWTHAVYQTPAGRSVAEVFRHYEEQLAGAGYEIVYSCRGPECGEGGRKTNGDWWPVSDHRRFLAARQRRPSGDLWVSVHVHARLATAPVQHELDVVEAKPPAAPPPPRDESDPATLAKELRADGRAVLRSLEFVDQRAEPLPGSRPVIAAIAALLARDPALKLYVVVHTDDTAPAAAHLDLSRKRAAAVVASLTRQHRIAAARLHAAGVGPFAPVASNRSEEGRASNRRVELVVQGEGRGGVATAGARR